MVHLVECVYCRQYIFNIGVTYLNFEVFPGYVSTGLIVTLIICVTFLYTHVALNSRNATQTFKS